MFRRPRWRRTARSLVSAGAAMILAATGLVSIGTGAQAAPGMGVGTAPGDKIRPDLAKQLQAKSAGDFWIRFKDRADLSKASSIKDWTKRGAAVAEALRTTAAASQGKIRAELDSSGTKYQTFWATNAIKVNSGSLDMAQKFAAHTEVEGSTPRSSTRSRRPSRAPTRRPSTRSSGASPTSTPTTSGPSTASPVRASPSPTSTPACSSTTPRL